VSRRRGNDGDGDGDRLTALQTVPGPDQPPLISDGGGLPFPPQALLDPFEPLDEADPDVAALRSYLEGRGAAQQPRRRPWRRRAAAPPPPPPGPVDLAGWRALSRAPGEVLYGRGVPPNLYTVALREETRPSRWIVLGSTFRTPLRATRDGIRASSWRVNPYHEPTPESTELRVLMREQGFAAAQFAHGRVLPPEIHLSPEQVILTLFVTPRDGWQNRSKNPETPVRITLPEPLGQRMLIDGAIIGATGGSAGAGEDAE
jgi:hypothetical protein